MLNESSVREVVDNSVGLLESKCIRLNGHQPEWRALFSAKLPEITNAGSAAELERQVNDVLASAGLSHVAFFHESAQRAPARYAINATFCSYETAGGSGWMFQDVHEGGPAHLAGIRAGDILVSANGEPTHPPVLPAFALGTDHVLTVDSAGSPVRDVRVELPKPESNGKAGARPPMAEPTSVVSWLLSPGVGYLRVAFFPGVNGQRFARALDQALAELDGCTRLIVDLQGNLGGFVGSLRLMSYLTPDRLPVGYSLTRIGEDKKRRPEQLACIDRLPSTKLDMIKMAVRFKVIHRDRSIRSITEGLGAKPFHGRVAMLVNEHTLSAGEMVAAFARENELARLVGTRTGGQVLGGANFSVGHGFTIRLPAAGWYTWSGTVVEGRGVDPDAEVPLSMEAIRRGEDNQLQAAILEVQRF